MSVKKLKGGYIFDRNDLFLEDIRDEIPDYMADEFSKEYGDNILDLETPLNKLPEAPDQTVKIKWEDVVHRNRLNDPHFFSTHFAGTITKNILKEIYSEIKSISEWLRRLNGSLYIPKFYYDHIKYVSERSVSGDVLSSFVRYINRFEDITKKLSDSSSSKELALSELIMMIYDNKFASIDFSSARRQGESQVIIFSTYEDRKINLVKQFKKLKKFIEQVQEGKKDIPYEEEEVIPSVENLGKKYNEYLLGGINNILNKIQTGALKSVILKALDQIKQIEDKELDVELYISSKPDDFLRMSISPFYTSCMDIYSGVNKRQVYSNAFETNSKIVFIRLKKPFTDCRGNEHPFTPLARCLIKKTDEGLLVLDNIYKMDALDMNFKDIINKYTDIDIHSFGSISDAYTIEYENENEKYYVLEKSYSDNIFNTKRKDNFIRMIIDRYKSDGEKGIISIMKNLGITVSKVEKDETKNIVLYLSSSKKFEDLLPFHSIDPELKDSERINTALYKLYDILKKGKYSLIRLDKFLSLYMSIDPKKFEEFKRKIEEEEQEKLTKFLSKNVQKREFRDWSKWIIHFISEYKDLSINKLIIREIERNNEKFLRDYSKYKDEIKSLFEILINRIVTIGGLSDIFKYVGVDVKIEGNTIFLQPMVKIDLNDIEEKKDINSHVFNTDNVVKHLKKLSNFGVHLQDQAELDVEYMYGKFIRDQKRLQERSEPWKDLHYLILLTDEKIDQLRFFSSQGTMDKAKDYYGFIFDYLDKVIEGVTKK